MKVLFEKYHYVNSHVPESKMKKKKKAYSLIYFFLMYWLWLSYTPLSEGTVLRYDCTIKVMVLHSCLRSLTFVCVSLTNRYLKATLLPVIPSASPVTESCQHCSTSNHFATWKSKCGLHLLHFWAKCSSWEAAEIQTGTMELELTAVVKGEAKVTDKHQEIDSWSHKHH